MPWYLHDFFDDRSANGYWRGSDGSTPPPIVKELAEMITSKFGVIESNEWTSADYIGGIRVKEERTCLFRVCNGGRDQRGRPHRWVLLVALVESAQWRGIDVFEVLESPIFRTYCAFAVPSPAPFPAEELRGESKPVDSMGQLPDTFTAHGTEAEVRARDCSRQLTSAPIGFGGILIVQKSAKNNHAWFTRESVPQPPLAVEVAKPTPPPVPVQPIAQIKPSAPHPLVYFVLGFIYGLIVGWYVYKFFHAKH
jgi:hypothetical protein